MWRHIPGVKNPGELKQQAKRSYNENYGEKTKGQKENFLLNGQKTGHGYLILRVV